MTASDFASIKQFRRELHQYPELSGKEERTAQRVRRFLSAQEDLEFYEHLGGHGLAAVHRFGPNGPTILIRCELDALPIQEQNSFAHQSKYAGVSHKCGHDGHMAIVAGLSFWLKKQPFHQGRVVLLFQPAEETGAGAIQVIQDQRFKAIKPDYVFAMHNIPGASLAQVILPIQTFSATVQSLAIYLEGKEAHAAQPEHAINPAPALSKLITNFEKLNHLISQDRDFAIVTPVCIKLGEKAYGVSPGVGELHFTIRTWNEETMQLIKRHMMQELQSVASMHQLQLSYRWVEYFPACVNNLTCRNIVKTAATRCGLDLVEKDEPFRFGEDFGWFSKHYRASMFGMGAGHNCPALHHNNYDFPDDLIRPGIDIFAAIISEILGDGLEHDS